MLQKMNIFDIWKEGNLSVWSRTKIVLLGSENPAEM